MKRLAWAWHLSRWWPSATPGDFARALVLLGLGHRLCFVFFQLVIGLTRPQANWCQHGIRPCILCLLLDRGLLAHLCTSSKFAKDTVTASDVVGYGVVPPPDDVFPRHVWRVMLYFFNLPADCGMQVDGCVCPREGRLHDEVVASHGQGVEQTTLESTSELLILEGWSERR